MKLAENRRIVAWVRKIVAWPNRHQSLLPLSRSLMRALARAAMRKANSQKAADLNQLHVQWERAAPALASYKLIAIEGDTAFAEIHSECALRGSGDVMACHRMMEYDREVMRAIGGEVVVLESQATPGRTFCRVALRRQGAPMSDLVPAHQRVIAIHPV